MKAVHQSTAAHHRTFHSNGQSRSAGYWGTSSVFQSLSSMQLERSLPWPPHTLSSPPVPHIPLTHHCQLHALLSVTHPASVRRFALITTYSATARLCFHSSSEWLYVGRFWKALGSPLLWTNSAAVHWSSEVLLEPTVKPKPAHSDGALCRCPWKKSWVLFVLYQ